MDEGKRAAAPAARTSRTGIVLLAAAAVAAAGAIGWRAYSGGGDASQALASRSADSGEPPSIEELKQRAEADPKDADAWQELGFAYFSQGDYARAASAYRQAVEGDPKAAVLWAALGEARALASRDDPMPPLAVSAFRKAIELDPKEPRARYYLAVRRDLDGDHEGAIGEWLALLADTPPGSTQEQGLIQTIEQVGKINGIDTSARIAKATEGRKAAPPALTAGNAIPPALTAGNAIPGPSQQDIAAAGSIPPSEQQKMAEGMVERLAARLRSNPKNVDGWVMLMRSRVTLGQTDRAKRALADALAANPGDAARLRQEAAALGIT